MPTRVALLAPSFWPEVRRGTERVIDELGRGLNGAGYEPNLIVGHPGKRSDSRGHDYRVIRVRRLPESPVRRALHAHEHHGHLLGERLELGRLSPGLVHSFYPTDAVVGGGWARRGGKPALFSIMGMPDTAAVNARRLRRGLWHRAIDRSSAVVVLSEEARRRAMAIAPEAIVIQPGTDLTAFQRIDERASAPTIFCPAAPEDPRKRVPLLIDAFRLLRRRFPDARLLLNRPATPGPVDDTEGVELLDLDPHDALVRAYSSAWLTVLPSLNEAFGLVLVESLACGTPVLACDDAGCPEVLGECDAAGSLFRASARADELANAIVDGFEQADTGAGAAEQRRRQAERFSADVALERYVRLYAKLLA